MNAIRVLTLKQIMMILRRIPHVVRILKYSVVIEFVRSGALSGFDVINKDGRRTQFLGDSVASLSRKFVTLLTSNSESGIIIVCDVRTGGRGGSGEFSLHTRVPHMLVEIMRSLVHMLANQELDALLRADPERLLVVVVEDEGTRLLKGRTKDMLDFIHRNGARSTIDEEPTD